MRLRASSWQTYRRWGLPEKGPLDLIKTGDFAEVNATEGMIALKKN